MDAEDFLKSLEDDFDHYAPYNHFDDSTDEDSQSLHLSSWHETVRSHMNSKPALPSSEHSIPKSRDVGSRSSVTSLGTRGNKHQSSLGSLEEEFAKSSKIRSDNLKSYRELRALTTVCRQGWNLSKGWKSRPTMLKSSIDGLQHDIQKWSDRVRQVSIPEDIGQGPRINYRVPVEHKDEPRTVAPTESNKFAKAFLKLYHDPSPGPRYNIRSNFEKGRVNQRHDTTSKDITFGIGDKSISTVHSSDGPGPIYFPRMDSISPIKASPKLYAGGREFFGSIYMDVYSKCSPGPAFNTTEAVKKLSHVETIHGTRFSAKSKQ